ncbi:MAG: hypothetical protein HKN68_22960 [Saprospiraceae bacterium]|nr:hypothetical protein [Saprospiraceae bacterium]
MKIKVFFILLLSFVTALSFMGCEGEVGPQGIQGETGPPGPTGSSGNDGEDGQNGAENCLECHGNNQLITAKIFQWENSIHNLGGTYERNISRCAGCHTSQGFLDRIATGGMEASETVAEPLPINCYTCHSIHQTYTQEDWALTQSDPVTIWLTDQTADLGNANQCINCHQPRIPGDGIPATDATGDYTITSTRYGPHHGAQGTMFLGQGIAGAYEIGEGYSNSLHTTLLADNACVTCHMAPLMDGRAAGGHTFRIATEEGDLNFNGCAECHTEEEAETIVTNTQAEISTKLETLAGLLRGIGILNPDADRSVPGTYTTVQVGCYYNYIFIVEDQSLGVHNAKYTRTLLDNSIAALQ